MKYRNILDYIKNVVRSKPAPPRESDLGEIMGLNFKSFRGIVFWVMGVIFVLSGVGIVFTLVNLETTILGVLMALFGLGLIAYPVYFSLKIHNALESGVVCVVPSSRMESNKKGTLSAVDISEFGLTADSTNINLNLREGDKVLAIVDPGSNSVMAQFNMIWEMS